MNLMADFYYLYDPADNLALGQAIHLANTDGGMSYIVPFAIKDGTVNTADAASVALQAINTAIAAGPLNSGGTSDPVSNRISAAAVQGLVGGAGWSAIKAMVKASINQAPPAGWNEASLEDGATTYSVISSKGYSQLQQDVFTAGQWKDADISPANNGNRGNPYIAFGGRVLDAAFIDYSGHHIPTPAFIGEETVSSLGINKGQMYVPNGAAVANIDAGDPVYGLAINAPGKDVTLVNFSATSTAFGRESSAYALDALGFTRGDRSDKEKALANALAIYSGNVTLAGDLTVDQLCQVVEGTKLRPFVIDINGYDTHVTIDNAKISLGAVRGWESMIGVGYGATLAIKDSTIYGFSSSNSNSPLLPYRGLDWPSFSSTDANTVNRSNGLSHLLTVEGEAVVRVVNSSLLREDDWIPDGEFSLITRQPGSKQFWRDNDYKALANGDLYIGNRGTLEIDNSTILGTILVDQSSDSLTIVDSVVAGTSFDNVSRVDGVRLEGGDVTLRNSLIDHLDVAFINRGRLQQETDTHILATETPKLVSTTTDPSYIALPTFAGPSSRQRIEGWADLDNAATGNKAVFEFQGPQSVLVTPSNKIRSIPVQLSESALPKVGSNGAVTYFLTATFDEAVNGFDSSDLQKALGTSAVAAGWQVSVAPFTRDGGLSWTFQLQSPVSFSEPVPLQLATGAAQSKLVTFPSSLESSASNSFSLIPVVDVTRTPVYRFYRNGIHFYTTSNAERDNLINQSYGSGVRYADLSANTQARDLITGGLGYKYEGIAYQALITQGTALYRFFNPSKGSHFITANANEALTVIQNSVGSSYDLTSAQGQKLLDNGWGFKFEGNTYKVSTTAQPGTDNPVYRFFNATRGDHFYSSSLVEAKSVIANSLGAQYATDSWISSTSDAIKAGVTSTPAPLATGWGYSFEGVAWYV